MTYVSRDGGLGTPWDQIGFEQPIQLSMDRPNAVIFDIDGTLASTLWREHYVTGRGQDWSAFHGGMVLDAPIPAAVDLAKDYHARGFRVIALSLRPNRFYDHTAKWLTDAGVPFDELYLRPNGNYGDGAKVKRDLYETEIKPRLNVVRAFDDYLKMTKMWDEAGVPATLVSDPGLRPREGQPATDPKFDYGVHGTAQEKLMEKAELDSVRGGHAGDLQKTYVGPTGQTTQIGKYGTAPKQGHRRGGSITEKGQLSYGGGSRLRAWIPPHESVSELGKPYHVKGHWRRLETRLSRVETLRSKMPA